MGYRSESVADVIELTPANWREQAESLIKIRSEPQMEAQAQQPVKRPMPMWLSIPVILLCLFAGGWIIHLYVISDPISRDMKVLSEPGKTVGQTVPLPGNRWNLAPGGGGGNFAKPRTSITPYVTPNAQKDRWDIKTDTAEEWVILNDKKEINTFRLLYNNDVFLPAEVRERFKATDNLLKNVKAVPEAEKLTKDQTQRLRTLAAYPHEMVVTPKERNELRAAFMAYYHAPDASRPAMEPAMFKALDDLAARSMPGTITTATARAAEINQIVTPLMWQQNAGVK